MCPPSSPNMKKKKKRNEEWPIDCWPLVLNGPQRVNSFFFFSLSYYIATQHVTHNKHGQWGVHTTLEKKKIKREGRCVCGGGGWQAPGYELSFLYIYTPMFIGNNKSLQKKVEISGWVWEGLDDALSWVHSHVSLYWEDCEGGKIPVSSTAWNSARTISPWLINGNWIVFLDLYCWPSPRLSIKMAVDSKHIFFFFFYELNENAKRNLLLERMGGITVNFGAFETCVNGRRVTYRRYCNLN